jgi:hypothetical protein
VIFPKTPIIIAMNLNTMENSRTFLGTVETSIVESVFATVILDVKIRTRMLSSSLIKSSA